MRSAVAGAILGLFLVRGASAISPSSVDTFAVDSAGWSIGNNGTQPAQNPGPGFDGQSGFLTQFSDGGGSNGKWQMFSDQDEWVGAYEDAGVTGISFWADEEVGTSLGLRIAFFGDGGWFYSAPQTITNSTAGPDWTQLSYDLAAGGFTYVAGSGGTESFDDTMEDVSRFEIFGGPGPITFHPIGNVLDAGASTNTVGIDQIMAVSEVPEPSTLLAPGLAALLLGIYFRRHRSL